jgi:acetyl-CoA carboxylase biotin carboxyl carrier protein
VLISERLSVASPLFVEGESCEDGPWPAARAHQECDLDHKELRELIEIISRSNFSSFELEREGFKLKLVKDDGVTVAAPPTPPPARATALPMERGKQAAGAPPDAVEETGEDDGLVTVASPIVGTYYEAPSPGVAAFVKVGDRVGKGQVLCIVEAMKLMNEIESEIDAEVIEILASNGQPVEFGERLFKLRPMSA